MSKKLNPWLALIILILIPQIAGIIGATFTSSSVSTWYTELEKPWFNPPSIAFGIVWPLLYVLMGVASWRIWKIGTDKPEIRSALWLYGIHLIFNIAWSYLFFTLRSPGLALIEIIILYFLIILTTWVFFKYDNLAGWLMVPYVGWVTFAIMLNASIWWLN